MTYKYIEEPIILNEKKHSLVLVNDIESANLIVSYFVGKNIKASLHPSYSKKVWKNKEIDSIYSCLYNNAFDEPYEYKNSQYESETCEKLQFGKVFMEDII